MDSIINAIAHDPRNCAYPSNFKQPIMAGEYDVRLPITPGGLCIVLKFFDERWLLVKNWQVDALTNSPGYAETCGKIKLGDAIVGVNGSSILGMKFKECIKSIGDQKKNSNYITFRFLSGSYLASNHDFCSMNSSGGAFRDDVLSKMRNERKERKYKIFNAIEEKVNTTITRSPH